MNNFGMRNTGLLQKRGGLKRPLFINRYSLFIAQAVTGLKICCKDSIKC